MNNNLIDQIHPSRSELVKATVIAVGVAALLLVTVVLPAEYGLDPLGTGDMLGFTMLASESMADDNEVDLQEIIGDSVTGRTASDLAKFDAPLDSRELELVLEPYDGIELKALMLEGERMVFSWQTDGAPVYVDMHGEKPNAGDEFTSYWKEKQFDQARGAFTAPFDGAHGWYWQNKGESTITISVEVNGFFEKLYVPWLTPGLSNNLI